MDCYTGPYWSNGKIQSSVSFGDCEPTDLVDYQSRLHDTAFDHFGDTRHRTAADYIYSQRLAMVAGLKSAIVRDVPLYGNLFGSSLSGFLNPFYLPAALRAIYNGNTALKEIKSGGYDKEISDVLKLYAKDPLNMGNFPGKYERKEDFIDRENAKDREREKEKEKQKLPDLLPTWPTPTPSVGLPTVPPTTGQPSSEVPLVTSEAVSTAAGVLGDNFGVYVDRHAQPSGLFYMPYRVVKHEYPRSGPVMSRKRNNKVSPTLPTVPKHIPIVKVVKPPPLQRHDNFKLPKITTKTGLVSNIVALSDNTIIKRDPKRHAEYLANLEFENRIENKINSLIKRNAIRKLVRKYPSS